ncbi:MAG: N-acetylmuramoyl-L-alanine amidase [Woeseiaceae bacterium]|jgi:N-acetylmuramoyl-L-alanine amidase|tara:strand:- start:12274 stop:13590 length:1317 start_codon:yes stop_codon:yes gene_type:complete
MLIKRLGLFFILYCMTTHSWSAALLKDIRMATQNNQVRMVLDLDSNVNNRIFTLEKPYRMVIDLQNTKLSPSIETKDLQNNLIRNVRFGKGGKGALRVVIDLEEAVKFEHFSIPGNRTKNSRIVLDITRINGASIASKNPISQKMSRDIKIVIDPGHGGKDPGAIGPNGTWESVVVLAVSKRLVERINKTQDMRAYLTRSGDSFVPLRDRMEIARERKADLFVSIHADALDNNPRVRGASIYTLSDKGAVDEASKRLAKRENENFSIGDVSLSGKNDSFASLMMDLSQGATNEASMEVGEFVLKELASIGTVRKKKVQQSGLLVLKSPDVPSILIETTYISNPDEEKKLKDKGFQDKLAVAILRGIRNYFLVNPPQGTKFAKNLLNKSKTINYTVRRGDTLSEIADLYNINLSMLQSFNQIKGSTIRIGQTLRIPLYQ